MCVLHVHEIVVSFTHFNTCLIHIHVNTHTCTCLCIHILVLFLLSPDLMFEDMKARDQRKSKKPFQSQKPRTTIGAPKDFRKVGSIVDADVLPDTVRRVKLVKQSQDRPLGFYIRDGTSVRVTPYGLEKVPGIFISRLVPGGLAEGTGLLSVNDEITEVNSIEVLGKSLDQVTDMMVANSQNLIITVKPANQPPSTPRTGGTIGTRPPRKSSPPPRGTRSHSEANPTTGGNKTPRTDRATPSRQSESGEPTITAPSSKKKGGRENDYKYHDETGNNSTRHSVNSLDS